VSSNCTNKHFTLKEPSSSEIDWRSVSPKGQRCSADQNPLKRSDLDDFVACYNPNNRHERKESERFKSFTYEELLKRDKLNLDIFWLKDESLEDSANSPAPTSSPPKSSKISKLLSRNSRQSRLI
jgi:hypothetical protein